MTLLKSHSMRTSFKSCPRKLFFRYVAGISLKNTDSKARVIGSIFHKGLESLRNGEMICDVMEDAKRGVYASSISQAIKQVEACKVASYLVGYLLRFKQDWERQPLLKTEYRIETDNEVCIIDALMINDDGSIDIIEDKTTSQLISTLESSLCINDQLLNYVDLCKRIGLKIRYIHYRETLKSSHKLNRNESMDEFRSRIEKLYMMEIERYREFTVKPLERELPTFYQDKLETDLRIDDMIDAFIDRPFWEWPRNTCGCVSKYGPCDYLHICSAENLGLTVNCFYEANDKPALDNNNFKDQYEIGLDTINLEV